MRKKVRERELRKRKRERVSRGKHKMVTQIITRKGYLVYYEDEKL